MGIVDKRLAELGLVLPEAPAPAANYVPFTVHAGLVHVSGQLPMRDGAVAITGKLGAGVSLEQGQEAARLCALAILAQARAACEGDLDRIRRVLRVGGFVASAPGFTDQPKVINGASDLLVAVLGDVGRHARAAVGVAVLPLDAAVEVDAVLAID
jgi:enamine deaminase RidA (YjgF/YER057c/UK114 family)